MFAAKEDKWRKACKRMSPEKLRTTIKGLEQEQERLLAKGALASTESLVDVTRKIEIAGRVLGTKESGGYISR